MEVSKKMVVELGDSELKEPTLDIHALFCHYNALYFHDALGACVLSWSSDPPMNRCTGTSDYHFEGGCEIRLSEPLLKFRATADLKNTLLHEMIHALLWIENGNRDHSDHGATFQDLMNAINSSSVVDHQRPFGGYNITIYHDFNKEVDNSKVYNWICKSCGDSIERTMNQEPSASDCIEDVGHDESCSNPSCQWHSHKKLCSGSYTMKAESSGFKDEKMSSKGEQEVHSDRFKGLHYTRSTRGSSKTEVTKENTGGEKAITITNFFPSEGDAKRNSVSNSSGDDSRKELHREDNTKAIVLKDQSHDLAPEIPKRARAPLSKKKQTCTGRKRRKYGKCQNEYNVIIQWLDVYANEEAEDDVEPLINKRTERRKKQKLLKTQKLRAPEIEEDMDDVFPSTRSSCCRIGEESCHKSGGKCSDPVVSEAKMEEHGIPASVDSSEQNPGEIQAHADDNAAATETMDKSDEGVPLLSSPVRDDVVDISDG